jgi:hypothetical protein
LPGVNKIHHVDDVDAAGFDGARPYARAKGDIRQDGELGLGIEPLDVL